MGYPGGGWWWSERLNWVSHAKGIITKYTPHELNLYRVGAEFQTASERKNDKLGDEENLCRGEELLSWERSTFHQDHRDRLP